ncbi:MAG TPA: signal peptidase I [Terriglobales bacterium]|nr:signal peptidase I [Terriglobales bacterium]
MKRVTRRSSKKHADRKRVEKEKAISSRETPLQFSVSMLCTLVIALFVLTFNVQAFEIPTGSMERTLLVGDHILAQRFDVGTKTTALFPHNTIHDGDVLVFFSPAQPDLHFVKRIIGVPGDRLRLDHGDLIRNGKRLQEPYVIRDGSYIPYRDNFPNVTPTFVDGLTPGWQGELSSHIHNGELVVPAGNYFAMGDNRDHSYDSRYWGFVPQQNIIGRPLIIYWSFKESSDEYLKTSPGDRLKHGSHVVLHFFDQTRWNRMLRFVR